ncbi:MAG: thioredoxin family protein [Candidatus Methanomethylicaceae archaeon]
MKSTNYKNFKDKLKEGKRFIAIFTASWCGYCKILMKELEYATPDIPLIVVDISDEKYWDEFGIEIVPTAILYEGGTEVRRISSSDGLRLKDLQELFLSTGND